MATIQKDFLGKSWMIIPKATGVQKQKWEIYDNSSNRVSWKMKGKLYLPSLTKATLSET